MNDHAEKKGIQEKKEKETPFISKFLIGWISIFLGLGGIRRLAR